MADPNANHFNKQQPFSLSGRESTWHNFPVHEVILFQYSSALEEGNFETVAQIRANADTNPPLLKMLEELEEYLEQERFGYEDAVFENSAAGAVVQNAKFTRLQVKSLTKATVLENSDDTRRLKATKANLNRSDEGLELLPPAEFEVSSPVRPQKFLQGHNRLPLTLVAGLVVILLASAALLIWSISRDGVPDESAIRGGSNSPAPEASPGPPPSPTVGPVDLRTLSLDYPGATVLKWDESASFPNGRPAQYKDKKIFALATNDDYKMVAAYYQKSFEALGLKTINAPEGCGPDRCGESSLVQADKDGQQVVVLARSPQIWQGHDEIPAEPFTQPLVKQLKPDQTLVIVLNGPVYPPVVAASTPTATEVTVQTANPASTASVPVPTTTTTTRASLASATYLGPDNAFHMDSGSSLVSKSASKEIATSQPGLTFNLLWLVSDTEATHLLGTFHVNGRLNEDLVRPTNSLEIGTLNDNLGQQYQLKTFDGKEGYANGRSSTYYYLDMSGPPLQTGATQVTFKPGPGLPIGFAGLVTLDLQSFKAAGLSQGYVFNQSAKINDVTLKVFSGYFEPNRTLLKIELGKDSQNSPQTGSGLTMLDTPRVGQNLTITTDQGVELQTIAPRLGEYMPAGVLFLEPLPPGTKSLSVKLLSSGTATMATPSGPARQTPFKVSLADLIKTGPLTPGPDISIDGYTVKILREEASIDPATGKVILKLRYQLPTEPDARGVTMRTAYPDCAKCSSDGNISGGGGQTETPDIFEFQLKFNYHPDVKEVELSFNNVSYNLPGPWLIKLPLPDAVVATANNPAGKLPPPVVSSKSLGTTIGKVRLGMSETEMNKVLGPPGSREIIVSGKKVRWQYPGMSLCGPIVSCIETENYQTGITAEGFKLGEDKATFRKIYAGFTVNDTADPGKLVIKDQSGISLTVYFDEADEATRLLLQKDETGD